MSSLSLFWLILTLVCIATQSFYSMQEMACVSFNRIRLQYYVNQGNKRAQWLSRLLHNPAKLFGTTLIGVNVSLQIGSECSRQFYQSLNLDPTLAPLTQVFLVLIFAELAPMFAARRFAEHVSMMGIPIIYASSKVLTPAIWIVDGLSTLVNRFFGGSVSGEQYALSRDEVQRVLEQNNDEGESPSNTTSKAELNSVITKIFGLQGKTAKQLMEALGTQKMLPSDATVGSMRRSLRHAYYPYVLMFHQQPGNILKIIYPRDLLHAADSEQAQRYAKPPWFITQDIGIYDILQQFRQNNRNVAVVLNRAGQAIGILTLQNILEELFGALSTRDTTTPPPSRRKEHRVIERSFYGTISMQEVNRQLDTSILAPMGQTLSQYLAKHLGHIPEEGEFVRIHNLEFRVESTSFFGARKVSVTSFEEEGSES